MAVNILFPAGLFWLAWTSPEKYNYWIPMMRWVLITHPSSRVQESPKPEL